MSGCSISLANGVHYLTGHFDEGVDYRLFPQDGKPLLLNLRGIINVNSVGVRGFLHFIQANAKRVVELHECSAPFVDMINSIPGTLGNPPRPGMVKSAFLPYVCEKCQHQKELLVDLRQVTAARAVLPKAQCPACKATLLPPDPEEALTFLYTDD